MATYFVIRCAVLQTISQPTLRHILINTMNIEGNGAIDLRTRRLNLMREGTLSPNSYLARETEAYEELQAILVALDSTPCQGELVAFGNRKQIIEMAQKELEALDDHIQVEIPLAPLIAKLLEWFVSLPPYENYGPAGALLEVLPGLTPYMDDNAIGGLPGDIWWAFVREGTSTIGKAPNTLPAPAFGNLVSLGEMQSYSRLSLMGPVLPRQFVRRAKLTFNITTWYGIPRHVKIERGPSGYKRRYFSAKKASIDLFAQEIAAVEEQGEWERYFPGRRRDSVDTS